MEKESCDTREALEKLRETIARYSPQGPVSFRTEKAKVEYLYSAAANFERAIIPLTQCYSYKPLWSFRSLFTALDTSRLQEQRLPSEPVSVLHETSTVL